MVRSLKVNGTSSGSEIGMLQRSSSFELDKKLDVDEELQRFDSEIENPRQGHFVSCVTVPTSLLFPPEIQEYLYVLRRRDI